jgi:hypothetical protein
MSGIDDQRPGSPAQPAGWYPDPAGQAELRWWDGTRWTQQTRAETDASIMAAPATGRAASGGRPVGLRKGVAGARGWWSRASWPKRLAAGFVGLMLISGIANAVDPPHRASSAKTAAPAARQPDKAAVAPAPPAITAGMIVRKGAFWSRQSHGAKLALVGYCLADAKQNDDTLGDDAARWVGKVDREAVARKIDRYYADKDEHFFGGVNADDPITEPCREAASTLAEAKAEAHEKALRASVEPAHFRATAQRVRRYYAVESQEDDLRSVACVARVTCRISINGNVGDLGKVGDLFFGEYNRDYEAQLVLDTTELYHRLFHDAKFQHGTVTTWLAVETPGGKVKKVPALSVSCDRSADQQIDWERVGPEGLRRYCDYALRPIQGLS